MSSKYSAIIKKAEQYFLVACGKKNYEDNFKIWGPYQRHDLRKIVIVKDLRTGKKRTVSWPKWIMECHLQKQLDPDESTVDHLDFDFHNNDLSNLRIVPRDQHSADDTRRVKLIKLKCSMCKKDFERSPRLIRDKSKKGKRGAFCSRHCSGQYARSLQLGKIKRFPKVKPIKSEYYRRKNLAEISQYLIKKYARYISMYE